MVRPGRNRLSGTVEVDETLIGGESHRGKRGRGSERKIIVVIAIEVFSPKGFGRVRMRRIEDASGSNLIPFVCESIEPGSTVHTDGWLGYNGLAEHGYIHMKKNISESGDPAHVIMPGVHRISALLKRWLISTHQGAVSDEHMDYYLDEYTFRFNRRKSKSRGMLFYRLLQQAVEVGPVPYKNIIKKNKQ